MALFALLSMRLSGRERHVAPIVALGQRSMSGYLFPSVAWLAIFSPWALGLGGATFTAVIAAVAVWAVSLAAAQRMSEAGYRGPAETLLRRITYRAAA